MDKMQPVYFGQTKFSIPVTKHMVHVASDNWEDVNGISMDLIFVSV